MNILFIYFRKINKILEINKDDFCDKLEGWDGGGRWEGGSKGKGHIYLWLIQVDIWQKPKQYCKAIILQLKINK